MLKYQKEIDRLERAYNEHFNTLWNMVSKAKFALMKRFFETVASRVKHVYDIANRDVEAGCKAVDVAAGDAGRASTTCSCGGGSRASSASTARAASSRSASPNSSSRRPRCSCQVAALSAKSAPSTRSSCSRSTLPLAANG